MQAWTKKHILMLPKGAFRRKRQVNRFTSLLWQKPAVGKGYALESLHERFSYTDRSKDLESLHVSDSGPTKRASPHRLSGRATGSDSIFEQRSV
jgi:hypothetical protein